jgi:hypothetical protein
MSSRWLDAFAIVRGMVVNTGSELATGASAHGPFACPACGRTVAVSWPARSVLCRCGLRLVSPPQPVSEPH